MKTHKWILPVVMQERTGLAKNPAGVARTDTPGRAARGILILALVLGGLGAEGAITSGHDAGDQASAHNAAGGNRLETTSYLPSAGHVIPNTWMY
jgi:hypothetical protein